MAAVDNTEQAAAGASREAPRATMGGYLISESAEMKLGNFAKALRGIAILTEGMEVGREVPDMPADELAAIFYTLAEATDAIRASAAITLAAVPVRPRGMI